MPEAEGGRGSLERGAPLLVAAALAGFAADYLFNARLASALAPHEFGDFRVAWALATLLGASVLLGGDRAAPKALAGAFERGELARVWEYLRFYLLLAMGLSALAMVLTWLAGGFVAGSAALTEHHAISWAMLAVPISAAGALASRALQSARRPVLASSPWRVGLPLLSLALVTLLARARGRLDVKEAVLVATLGVLIVTLWQWWLLRRLELKVLLREPSGRRARSWLAASMPMMGVFLVALALSQSDLYFLELLGDEHEVGRYAAASTVAHLILVLQTALVGLVAPHAQLAFEQGPAAVRRLAGRCHVLMLATILPAALLLVLLARPLLSLFGSGYAVAEPELAWLVAGNSAWAFAAFSTLCLQYDRRGLVVVAITAATLVSDSVLNLLLIPTHGMGGAAASTAFTTAGAALAVLLARRHAQGQGRRRP